MLDLIRDNAWLVPVGMVAIFVVSARLAVFARREQINREWQRRYDRQTRLRTM